MKVHEDSKLKKIESVILDRIKRRPGLSASLEKMKYSERAFLGDDTYDNALYVGVGHGHDAVLQLVNGRVNQLDGVDPFYGKHGNDDADYENLIELIQELDLQDRFFVHKKRIETFLSDCDRHYDLIVLSDVLHHIFVTEEMLDQTELFGRCVALFRALHKVAENRCVMAISESPPSGLRPTLTKRGVLKSAVKYQTKQPAVQWRRAAEEAGWLFEKTEVYVPFVLRQFSTMLKLPPLPWLYSTRYFLTFRRDK